MSTPLSIILGNSVVGPIVPVRVVETVDPRVSIHFKDGIVLNLVGLTAEERDGFDETGINWHDDIEDSGALLHRDMGVLFDRSGMTNLRQGGEPHPDPRVRQQDWQNTVSSVTVTTGAGPYGLLVALCAAGWGPAISSRIDVVGHMRMAVGSRDSAELARYVGGAFRSSGRKYVRVA